MRCGWSYRREPSRKRPTTTAWIRRLTVAMSETGTVGESGDGALALDLRLGLAQATAETHRFDALGKARPILGLDEDATERAGTVGRGEALGRQLLGEAGDRHRLLHADNGIIVTAHAGIGLVGGALRQDLVIRRRHM